VARKKEERIEFRCTETLYNFLEQQQEQMSEQMGTHVPLSEVVRRMLTVFMYLHMSPGADLGDITRHSVDLEDYLGDVDDLS